MNCILQGRQPGEPDEAYTGTMTTIGLDIGVTTGGMIVWAVFAGTNRYAGMLAGTYVGATAEVSIAAGLGANVLVGGSNRTVALQPLSVQGQIGLNIAAGIGAAGICIRCAEGRSVRPNDRAAAVSRGGAQCRAP